MQVKYSPILTQQTKEIKRFRIIEVKYNCQIKYPN